MQKVPIPEVLPTSPLSLWCPFCGAKPGKDCQTSKSGFAVLHLLRVAAAALIDTKANEVRKNAKRTAAAVNKKKDAAMPS